MPVAIFRIDTNRNVPPFVMEMMNATGMAFDREGSLYVSSRYDGTVYRVSQERRHDLLRRRHGSRHRHRLRPRR